MGKLADAEKTIVKELLSNSKNDMHFVLCALDQMNIKPSALKELIDNASAYAGFSDIINYNGGQTTLRQFLFEVAGDNIEYFTKFENGKHYIAKVWNSEVVEIALEFLTDGKIVASAQNFVKVAVFNEVYEEFVTDDKEDVKE